MRGTLFWFPYNKDPTIWGIIFGSPIFGNSHICRQDKLRRVPTSMAFGSATLQNVKSNSSWLQGSWFRAEGLVASPAKPPPRRRPKLVATR